MASLRSSLKTFRATRRKVIKRYGKRAFRRLDRYLARQSLIPNQPLLDPDLFPWAAELEAQWQTIRTELDAVLQLQRHLPRFQDISPDQRRISPDDQWRVFVFYGFGYRSESNCRLCPKTAALLDAVPTLHNAFFSILAPGKHIPSHHGITKGLVRCHLGLVVPQKADRCTMDVGNERCRWQEGKVLFFDDTYPHQVRNDTQNARVVLLLDVRRPMTWRGAALGRLQLWLLRRTAYVRDAYRNQARWEQAVQDLV